MVSFGFVLVRFFPWFYEFYAIDLFCVVNLDGFTLEELSEQVSRLSASLSREGSNNFQEANVRPKSSVSKSLSFEKNCFTSDSSSMEDIGVQIVDSEMMTGKRDSETVIILSDDEVEPEVFSKVILPVSETGHHISNGNTLPHAADNSLPAADRAIQNVSYMKTKEVDETFQKKDITEVFNLSAQKQDSGYLHNKPAVTSFIDSKGPDNCRSLDRINLTKSFVEAVNAKNLNKVHSNTASKTSDTASSTNNKVLSDFRDSKDDLIETALKSVRHTQVNVPKPISVLRRKVIQLKTPLGNRAAFLHKSEDPTKRFKPPRLDDWFKPILEIDYFAIAGLSARKDENQIIKKLKEVPVYFQSSEQYLEIFQPLVLEEFKAQLQNSFLEMPSWEEMFYGSLSVMSVERIDDFHLVRFVHDGDSASCRSFSENDFVLLTKGPPQKSSHDVHMVGKVYYSFGDSSKEFSCNYIKS